MICAAFAQEGMWRSVKRSLFYCFTVRCYDGAGAPQIVEETPPAPAGASGLHSKSVML
jgi:hypothetical protein